MGKRALAAHRQFELKARVKSQTTEDFTEEGAADEESGDRWLGLDLAKALRFYQKAFLNYQAAIGLNNSGPDALQEAYYNALRLLFQVYSQYSKNDGVKVLRLNNVGEVLTGDENSVVQDISAIVAAHERSIDINPGSVPLDLFFNTALVYTDAIEETEDSRLMEEYATKGQALFKEVLRQQVSEFQEFLQFTQELDSENSPEFSAQAPSPTENQQYTSTKTVQPPDLLDTVISGLGLCQAVLESVGKASGSLLSTIAFIGPFAHQFCIVANDLVHEYTGESSKAAPIDQSQRDEYLVIKAYIQALSCPDLHQVYEVWDSEGLPKTSQRYMLAADSIGTVLDRLEINNGPQSHVDIYWTALTKMNNYFKQAQELLNAEYQQMKSKTMTDAELGVGALIARIASVYIARSDIDLQRSQLQHEQGQKNSQVLFNNAKAFLKNAMNLAKVSGGIREKAIEKAQRERRRYEAVSRLCVLDNKTSPEELNTILGQGSWEEELASYRELWYFQPFLRQ